MTTKKDRSANRFDMDFAVESSLEGHKDFVKSVLYFKVQHKIVSCSSDSTIRIWDSRSLRCLGKVRVHNNSVNHLLKWEDDTFLSCSSDKTIKSFRILDKPPYIKYLRLLHEDENKVYRLLRISSDLLIFLNGNDEFSVLSFTQGRKVKTLKGGYNTTRFSTLVLSKKLVSCIFVNTFEVDNIDFPIFMINFLTWDTVKTFKGHRGVRIEAITSYLNKDLDEFLVCGGSSKTIFIYNTKNPEKIHRRVKVKTLVRTFYHFPTRELSSGVSKKSVAANVKNRIEANPLTNPNTSHCILVGSAKGSLSILINPDHIIQQNKPPTTEKSTTCSRLLRKEKTKGGMIFDITLFPLETDEEEEDDEDEGEEHVEGNKKPEKKSYRFLCSSADHSMKIIRVSFRSPVLVKTRTFRLSSSLVSIVQPNPNKTRRMMVMKKENKNQPNPSTPQVNLPTPPPPTASRIKPLPKLLPKLPVRKLPRLPPAPPRSSPPQPQQQLKTPIVRKEEIIEEEEEEKLEKSKFLDDEDKSDDVDSLLDTSDGIYCDDADEEKKAVENNEFDRKMKELRDQEREFKQLQKQQEMIENRLRFNTFEEEEESEEESEEEESEEDNQQKIVPSRLLELSLSVSSNSEKKDLRIKEEPEEEEEEEEEEKLPEEEAFNNSDLLKGLLEKIEKNKEEYSMREKALKDELVVEKKENIQLRNEMIAADKKMNLVRENDHQTIKSLNDSLSQEKQKVEELQRQVEKYKKEEEEEEENLSDDENDEENNNRILFFNSSGTKKKDLKEINEEKDLKKLRNENMRRLKKILTRYEEANRAISFREAELKVNQCQICFERDNQFVFQCGHIACDECSDVVEHCPYCRDRIETRIKIFRS